MGRGVERTKSCDNRDAIRPDAAVEKDTGYKFNPIWRAQLVQVPKHYITNVRPVGRSGFDRRKHLHSLWPQGRRHVAPDDVAYCRIEVIDVVQTFPPQPEQQPDPIEGCVEQSPEELNGHLRAAPVEIGAISFAKHSFPVRRRLQRDRPADFASDADEGSIASDDKGGSLHAALPEARGSAALARPSEPCDQPRGDKRADLRAQENMSAGRGDFRSCDAGSAHREMRPQEEAQQPTGGRQTAPAAWGQGEHDAKQARIGQRR